MSGEGKISLALGGAKKGKPAPTNGVKRSHAALQDGEEEDQLQGKAQTVSHFDRSAGGAIDESNKPKKEQPLVIKPQANRDWKEASQRNKRQKVPPELQQNGRAEEIERRERESKPTYGMNVMKKDDGGGQTQTDEPMDLDASETTQQVPPEANGEVSLKQKTDEELAMDALLGKTNNSDLVVPAMTEEEAFERDYKTAPEMATLDDYARVPVEQFGAAILRGMGWKEGEGIGSQRGKKIEKVKIPERRPALLGIGAKEEAAVKEEMGAWGKGARGKEAKVYNPVVLRDKRTGETFTEEELEKRKKDEERKKYELEFEEKEKEKEHSRRRDDEREGKDSRRERDRGGKDRRRDDGDEEYYRRKEEKRRRREKERDESDDEYYRRKEKEKRRRDRDRDHRDSDRERSRRHDSSRERRRDRDRDRSRERRRRD